MNLFKESVEYNISTLLPILKLNPVSGAAFSQARYKIDLSFFKDLNRILVNFHQQKPSRLWKGFQLIAGDGSTVALPSSRQVKDYFGIHSQADCGIKNCMAQIFMLYDVYTNMVVDGRISKMENSERTLLKESLADLPITNAIYLLDRGFGFFNICKRFLTENRMFCIRIKSSGSAFSKLIMENPSSDFLIEWKPSDKEKITCNNHQLDKEPIKVRVSKIALKTGEIEVLISSLYDRDKHSLTDMKELYSLRWGIEEGFKKLKPKMKLEQFGSRKPEGIFQEFEAHLFMMNLVALIGNEAQQQIDDKCAHRVLKYKYNWQNAYRFIRNKIVQFINLVVSDHHITQLIASMTRSLIALKPDRVFPRPEMRKNKARQYQTYK